MSNDMKSKEVPFGMNRYFNKNILPKGIKSVTKRITRKTPNKQSEGETILFVYEGEGIIIINHKSFALKPGISIWLGPFHNYALIPNKGTEIEIEEIHTNSGAYLYILSCPYLKINKMLVPQQPAMVYLNEEEQETVRYIIEELQCSKMDENYFVVKRRFLLVMQLFGLLLMKFKQGKKLKEK